MGLETIIFTWLHGTKIGEDDFGNRYYCEKKPRHRRSSGGPATLSPERKSSRWVIYKGSAEASKVPPEWHAWLHRLINEIPTSAKHIRWMWQKPHLPNLTGTRFAYRPPGHQLARAKRAHSSGDYESWHPRNAC